MNTNFILPSPFSSVFIESQPCLEIYGKSSEVQITPSVRGTMGLLINSNTLNFKLWVGFKETLKPMSTAGNE